MRVQVPHLDKKMFYTFVQHMWCNIWNLNLHTFSNVWYNGIAKTSCNFSFTKESINTSWSKCVASYFSNHIFIPCINLEPKILLLYASWIFVLASNVIIWSWPWAFFFDLNHVLYDLFNTTLWLSTISVFLAKELGLIKWQTPV